MTERIAGSDLINMIQSAASAINAEKAAVNELNVFPVPDGDTGTNMSLTLASASAELVKIELADASIEKVSDIIASALIRGARGNSGVILSLLFRGFSRRLKGQIEADGIQFAQALADGVDSAFKAVMKPAEGTILTVSRASAVRANVAAQEKNEVEYVLEQALSEAEAALKLTVTQNPVLAKAGVIDAGGRGYVIILEAMLRTLRGELAVSTSREPDAVVKDHADFSDFDTAEITFGYCTEFFVKTENQGGDTLRFRAYLETLGDSLVFVDDGDLIKIHVHTNNPGMALEKGLEYGALTGIKIENMREQHTKKITEIPDPEPKHAYAAPDREFGFVSVCAGEGLAAVFRDLGVDGIIDGGQTMNPSTQDILRKIDATPATNIFVLPNNKNIILAAEQCVGLSDKNVLVVHTQSVPQGISAMLAFDPGADAALNLSAMCESASKVRTAQITYAVRDTEFDGTKINEGDYLTLIENKIFSNSRDIKAEIENLAQEISGLYAEFITIFYGKDVTEADAGFALDIFRKACPQTEVNLLCGGQPVYYYIVSAE